MELSPKQTSAIQALAFSDMEEGMGQNVARAKGLQQELAQRRASLSQESAKAQDPPRERGLADWYHQRINDPSHSNVGPVTPKKIRYSPRKLTDCLLCWIGNKPSWDMSRNSRVVSLRCLMLSHLHPGWMNYKRRHLTFSQALWMPDMVLALNTCPTCPKIFCLWKRPFSNMNWLRKSHGAHIIPTMCTLPKARRGSNINIPKTSSQSKGG